MEPAQAIALGLIQGLTEFLPVSSSGHLVLLQNFFGMKEPELLFDICLHVGTLVAVLLVFYREIWHILATLARLPRLLRSTGGFKALYATNADVRLATLIVIGSVPTALLGLFFKSGAEHLFGAVWIVGLMLLVTGTLVWCTRYMAPAGRALLDTHPKDALVIGFVQGMAIIPGISRSGSTIATALFLGIDREVAGRYSFLLSVPAILGALALGLDAEEMQTTISIEMTLLGTLIAAIVGILALKVLLGLVRRGQLSWFAPYCWALGVLALVVGW
ncbi:MAG: undecaprenyl-diphosphate phosphatase [Desulfosarcinaceae bacterium]|nr:undecaprenyl-diphosphate phosphatase [Desulfosarcinaceae bacterium]